MLISWHTVKNGTYFAGTVLILSVGFLAADGHVALLVHDVIVGHIREPAPHKGTVSQDRL